ncbi:MAG TPA: argininosuccinate lyase [Thermoplasmata archaeon]|nr:argininosuccinate lyase [Thermoplasmata archaeon]
MSDRASAPSYVATPTAPFLNSLAVDRSLVRYDLAGSVAHAQMLARVGLLSAEESARLVAGLRTIAVESAADRFPWRSELEDVHTNVEVRLRELVGPVAGKLHTGRSRNDQVALDERLYLRAVVLDLASRIARLQEALVRRAVDDGATPMPGYTHLQRAQVVTVGHLLLAHFWRFDRDVERLLATEGRANVSPLGAGALAGSTLPLDSRGVAERLGFDRAFDNSLDAVSDRDPFAELLFDLALFGVHASALGEEIVLFASKEFGFVERTAALGSGSSLMPQKRNPDAAELVRGKSGRAIGDLVALLTVLKGLPLAYDRDLQEDKAPVLDAVATAGSVADALAELVVHLRFHADRLREAARDPELLATDLAETLVRHGTPFREAHEAVGAHYRSVPDPSDLTALGAAFPGAAADLATARDPDVGVARRSADGGPAPAAVARQVARAQRRLAAHAASLSSLHRKVELVEELLKEERT